MSDTHILKKIRFDLSELIKEFESQRETLNWSDNQESGKKYEFERDGRYISGKHGTKWCYFSVSESLFEKIEVSVGCRVFKKIFYLWDYGKVIKELPVHIDTEETNKGKVIAACVPLIGRFRIRFYEDLARTKPIEECVYGPGDLILINNRKYFHEGTVLDETRLGLHFFLDLEDYDPKESLQDLIQRNQL